jgi:hypothetical protein
MLARRSLAAIAVLVWFKVLLNASVRHAYMQVEKESDPRRE